MINRRQFSIIILVLLALGAYAQTADNSDNNMYWPQEIISGQDTIVVYQPQIETWKDNVMQSRSAVQYLSPGKDAVFGIIEYSSRTETDIKKNLVSMHDLKITKYNFPTLPDKGKKISKEIALKLQEQSQLSLDQVKSDLSINKAVESQKTDVKNDPPQVFYSTSPAALVLVDGDAVNKPIEGSSMQRVVNSSSFMVWNPDKKMYEVSLFGKWFTSKEIGNSWTLDSQPDSQLAGLLASALTKDTSIQTFDPPADEIKEMLDAGQSPQIFASTQPSELLITDGEPIYEPISNTNLLYVKNTRADMFKYVGDGMTYVLISGRWFKASDVHQAWSFVPPDKLPEDFKNIPEDHSKGSALVSVANTPQAEEAAITSQIPQTATVDRKNGSMQSTYDGSPNFQPIDGTGMQYAVNSQTPIIYVNNSYYAVSNGIWYNAAYPAGPWMVAVNIPAVIYSIPASNPLHYVTYVRVYGYTPTVVYVGYTPGYYGCYLNPYGTVVYGTGYRYRPWIGQYWYGSPYSYGMGVNFNWNSWAGWSMNYGYGARYYPSYRPWWGPMCYSPYRHNYYMNHNQINIYNYNRRNVIVNNNHFRSFNNYQHGGGYNGYMRGRANGNHYFAGRDGNVYRRDHSGSWQVNHGNQWQNVQNHQMHGAYQGRQQGNNRVQVQHNYHSANNNNHNQNMYNRPNSGNNNYNRGGGGNMQYHGNSGGGGNMQHNGSNNGYHGNGGGGNMMQHGGNGGYHGGGGNMGGGGHGGGGHGHH